MASRPEPFSLEASGAEARPRRTVHPPSLRKLTRPRVWAAFGAGALVLLAARPTPDSLALGSGVALLGCALRLWAAGHLKKTEELTQTGPYAYVRHPLYAGALIVGVGLLIATGPEVAPWTLAAGLPWFAFRYLPRKEQAEARRLDARHGEHFADYRAAVRALWPRRRAWRPAGRPARRSWSAGRVLENNELATLVGVLLAIAWLAVRTALGAG
ncbi:MAG: isoprenylcysteine carboxylmethyltransferase family protein [Myxococcota bacterium]|nr:isoprenylcysteine carboxylmethyltransferase family protein [Myxococcota bacterium]